MHLDHLTGRAFVGQLGRLQEMLLGMVAPTEASPGVDAATYWPQAPPVDDGSDTDHVRAVGLLSSASQKPAGGIRHLSATGNAVMRAATFPVTDLDFQGDVISTGDFFATWAVELAVDHLDLELELIMEASDPGALDLGRRTVEELAGGPAPAGTAPTEAILVAAGSLPPPSDGNLARLRIPAFG